MVMFSRIVLIGLLFSITCTAVSDCTAASAEFIYYDSYDDFSQWDQDATDVEGSTEFTSYDFPGYVGAQGFGNEGSFIYHFEFPEPIKTIVLEDEHNTHPSYLEVYGLVEEYKNRDTDTKVGLWVSPDGVDWTEVYFDRSQLLQTICVDLSDGYAGKKTLYVKYYFYMGNVKRQLNDPRGAGLAFFKLSGTLERMPTSLDKEYKIQLVGPRDAKQLPRKSLPAKLAETNSHGLTWWTNSLNHLSPWDIIDPEQTATEATVSLALAANESESVQIVFQPAVDSKCAGVSLRLNKLRGSAGNVLDARVYRLAGLQVDAKDPRPWPLTYNYLLMHQEDDRDDAPITAPFWITVHAPKGTPAGFYQGNIDIVSGDDALSTVPLCVEVFDFELPHQTSTRTALFTVSTTLIESYYNITVWSAEFQEFVVREFFEPLAERRISCGHATPNRWRDYTGYFLDKNEPVKSQVSPDAVAYFKKWARWWKNKGLHVNTVTPYAYSISYSKMGRAEDRDRALEFYRTYLPVLHELGIEREVYERTYDEPFKRNLEGVPWVRRHGKFAHEHFGSVPVYTSYGHPSMEMFREIDDATDIWAGIPIDRQEPKAEQFLIEKAKAGEQVWPYIHSEFGPSFSIRTRSYFWYLHRRGFNGVSLYTLNYWDHKQPPKRVEKNIFAGSSVLMWPGEKNMMCSLTMDHIRDGIEDREYLLMLERLLENASQDTSVSPEKRIQAETVLRNNINAIAPDYFDRCQNPQELYEARENIARAIASLKTGD